MMEVCIRVPLNLVDVANELARCVGYSKADGQTFDLAPEIGGYKVAAGIVAPSFPENALGQLTEPEWGCDLAKAEEAQALVQIIGGDWEGELPEDKILVVIWRDPEIAKRMLGVARH